MDVFSGLDENGYILINTGRSFEELGIDDFVRGRRIDRICAVPATELAIKHVGRPVPNVPLLGSFAAISGLFSLASVVSAIRQTFSGKIAEGNVAAATEAYGMVKRMVEEAHA